jgi:bacteriocin biosynthesis cyclodehydratase domain-containing protein
MGCLDQSVKFSYGLGMDRPPPLLRWSAAWAVEPGPDPTSLVLSAGADRRIAVDGLAADDRAAVERWAAEGQVPSLPPAGTPRARLVDRLVELGAAVPVAGNGGSTRVVAGDPAVGARLRDLLTEEAGDLVVTVRSSRDGWPAVPAGLHLGVDLALHHTVVLGPLVVPGVTACLACLDARASHRWGRPAVPARPAVQRRLAVVAALVDVQVGLVAAGTSPLVNATVAWNLETGQVDRQSLYKLAGCPRCSPAGAATDPADAAGASGAGRVALPWVAA